MRNKNIPEFRARKRSQRGAVMVESALILLTLLSSILFIMDTGRLMLFQQFYTERARAGVRQAVVNNWTSTQLTNYVVYGTTTAPSGAGAHSGFLGMDPSNVSVSTAGTAGTANYVLKVTVSGISVFAWFPLSGGYTAAPVIALMPYQSAGATN